MISISIVQHVHRDGRAANVKVIGVKDETSPYTTFLSPDTAKDLVKQLNAAIAEAEK